MSDLIKKSEVIKAVERIHFNVIGLRSGKGVLAEFAKRFMEAVIDTIKEQPTVEAKEVVRCKDCKHSDLPAVLTRKYGKIGTLTCHNRYSPCNNRNVNEKDFCSYGEMRTSAE